MASDGEKIVNDFCKAWTRRNIDEIIKFFTDDAVYHNIPMESVKGTAAIKAAINTFLPGSQSVEFRVRNTTSNGNVVMNERVDVFEMGGKHVEVPVAGVFEIRGGKIAAWRDYFDLATFTKQTR
ncbi:MAG TPA: limonene-1,2-epoxide hydrolase family protein [Candidatus Binataceae bacterium]